MNNEPIIFEIVFKAPISSVWSALTNKSEMKIWYFDLEEFKPEIGFVFKFKGGPSPERQYLHLCEITEVIFEKKLSYSWKYDGYPGVSYVKFELAKVENTTLLKFSHSGLETFPSENKDFDSTNFIEGWDYILNNSLKNYLEK